MAARAITIEERRARVAQRHHLAPAARSDDVARIADGVVALHSSDPVSVYLSAAARMAAPSIDAVSDALYADRSVVRLHAMRRTLWVASPDVARMAHAAATVKLVAPERRRLVKLLEDNGVDDGEAWIAAAAPRILDLLDAAGEATTREIGESLPDLRHPIALAPGKKYDQTVSAHTRMLTLLGFEGDVIRTRPVGTWVSGQYRWAHATRWMPDGRGLDGYDARAAAAGLARRWLRAFGPATEADLQWWTGWTARTTRAALDDAGAVAVSVDGGDAWVGGDDADAVSTDAEWVAFLPGLDPATMGWKERSWYLDRAHANRLFDRNGNGGPAVWVDGRIVGSWMQRPDGEIAYTLFTKLPRQRAAEVEAAAADLQALLGDTRVSVRFPPPVAAELLA